MRKKALTSPKHLAIAAISVVATWVALTAGADAADDSAAGERLFQKNCSACHTVGKGDLVGPDLKGVTTRRSREWLEQWIAAPDAMIARRDPIAIKLLHQFRDVPMPNLGLASTDVSAIIAYLANEPAAGSSAPTTKPAVQGTPQVGKELFTGVVRFEHGGPPCMACHSVSGIGALGGGRLGPDLTDVITRYGGAAAVDAFVAATPTPTMKAVWSKNPLSPADRANVVSFLAQSAVTQRPAEAIWQLGGLAVLGVVILLTIAAWRWSHRLRFGVRRPMVAKPTTGHTDPRGGGWFPGPYHGGWQARFANPADPDEPRDPANAPGRRS